MSPLSNVSSRTLPIRLAQTQQIPEVVANSTLRSDVSWVMLLEVASLDSEIPKVRFETDLVED